LDQGVILSGISAGAICWFESGLTDSFAGSLRAIDCLGMLPGSCCPHYSAEADRRPTYHRLIETGEMPAGIAIDDGAAVHFV
ncbi:peptidase E, partial [Enterococcus hirae]